MGTTDYTDLEELLAEAALAPPGSRIELRDGIAQHGAAAISRIETWLVDDDLAAFAVRVIERAAAYGARREAVDALKRTAVATRTTILGRDATEALRRLDPSAAAIPKPRHGRSARAGAKAGSASPEILELGRVYRRRSLHLQGLGGNRQSGISYPADGSYVLLFSDPEGGREHGYVDRWSGDHYLYYGQWTGTGDMVFEVGNRAILDRSTDLHLLVAAAGGHRYEGRFRLLRHETARTMRDGREWTAIVFVLERAGADA